MDGTNPLQPAVTARSTFKVSVVDPNCNVALHAGPIVAGVTSASAGNWKWPDRVVLHLPASMDGTYAVVFYSFATFDGKPAAVAIADAQLEQAPSPSADATPYVARGGSQDVTVVGECTLAPRDVRDAFYYQCAPGGVCYWILNKPFTLSEGIAGGADTLPVHYAGKFARGNDNYRFSSIAVNLVGTNVHQCAGTSDGSPCYASGYEQFGLFHNAPSVAVLTAQSGGSQFNFGVGAIPIAKALAAEKYLTLPVGSADLALVSQSEFEKVELRGRPLTGRYNFGIVDSRSLRWEHLEDVQFVIKYRYWSAVKQ